jgi:phosphate transport system protein
MADMTAPHHIVRSYDEDLQGIANRLVEMGGLVEAQLADAIEAMIKRHVDLARKTIGGDTRIDSMEREIDEATILLLARRQPMADDLREVVSALKIAGILERVGDYATHVAERAITITHEPTQSSILVIHRMGRMVRDLLSDALSAYAKRDADLALDVWRRDRDLDQLYASLFRELLTHMKQDSQAVDPCVHLLFVAKYIERIGDFATNIAEHVHFIVRGEAPEGKRPKADEAEFGDIDGMDGPA